MTVLLVKYRAILAEYVEVWQNKIMPEMIQRGVSRAKANSAHVGNEFRERLSGYLTGALGLVAGLAWNDAISSLIKYLFPAEQGNNLTAKFLYAFLVTILVVLLTTYMIRYIAGPPRKETNVSE